MMHTSEATDLIDTALAKAQAELENPTKDAVNPHFRSKYATLDAGLNIVRSVLSKHGISITQPTRFESGVLILETRIAFQGQWISSVYPVCQFPIKVQEMGSCLSYSRRYSLFSLVGIAGEEDDDGNSATTPTPAPARKAAPAPMNAAESQEHRDEMIEQIVACSTDEALLEWAEKSAATRHRMTADHRKTLNEAYKAQSAQIKGKENG